MLIQRIHNLTLLNIIICLYIFKYLLLLAEIKASNCPYILTGRICDAIWRKIPEESKIDFPIFDVLHRFKPALQDSVVEKILSLIVCSLRGFKHCHSGKHSRLRSHHIHIHKCCECGYSVFLSEDGRTGRTDTEYKPAQVCLLEEERNIGRALSARRHFCFSSKIYAWLLRALSSDRVTYITACEKCAGLNIVGPRSLPVKDQKCREPQWKFIKINVQDMIFSNEKWNKSFLNEIELSNIIRMLRCKKKINYSENNAKFSIALTLWTTFNNNFFNHHNTNNDKTKTCGENKTSVAWQVDNVIFKFHKAKGITDVL